MAIYLHPTKENASCYRVFKKIGGVPHQQYFSFSMGKRIAKKAAQEYEDQLIEKAFILKLQKELPSNVLFHEDGRPIGIQRLIRIRPGHINEDALVVQVKGIKRCSFSLHKYDFEAAYKMAIAHCTEAYDIELTPELKRKYTKAKKFFVSA